MSSRSSSSSSSLSVSLETKRTVHRGKLCLLETLDERERERVKKGEKAMENKEMAEPDGNSTSVEWCRVVPMVSSNKDSRGGQGRPKEFTILRANSRSRLSLAYDSRGRDWLVLSRSLANWLLPSFS